MSKRKKRPGPPRRLAESAAAAASKSKTERPAGAPSGPPDLDIRLGNALDVLSATPATDVQAVRQTHALLTGTLEAARKALREMEAQLDSVTGPDLNLAEQNTKLRQQLDDARVRQVELEQKLTFLQAERDTDRVLLQEEKLRARDLEKKTRNFEDVLMKDDDAFSRYFDAQLDAQERRGKKPPQR